MYGERLRGLFESEDTEFKRCGTGNLNTLVFDCLRYAVVCARWPHPNNVATIMRSLAPRGT